MGIRVLSGGKATRLEFRVTGADMNPHLAIAASVASGLWGVKNKLKLTSPQVRLPCFPIQSYLLLKLLKMA